MDVLIILIFWQSKRMLQVGRFLCSLIFKYIYQASLSKVLSRVCGLHEIMVIVLLFLTVALLVSCIMCNSEMNLSCYDQDKVGHCLTESLSHQTYHT